MPNRPEPSPRPVRSRLHRWALVAGGVVLVGIGAVGVVLPGLPTTIFLVGASWCFARSCPWLEDRLIRVPLFRPFLFYLDNWGALPRRAVVGTLVVMWLAITVSVLSVTFAGAPRPILAGTIVVLGLVGTMLVIRAGRRATPGFSSAAPRPEDSPPDRG